MSLKNKVTNTIKKKIKKVVFKAIKPFLPFILIIGLLFFAICTIIDAIFIQEVQSDTSTMSEEDQKLKTLCIQKAEYLNTCNNYVGSESTKYLLDIDSREADKEVQWSHLYSIMVFHNLTNSRQMDEMLLNEVASNFASTFIYEKTTIQTETFSKDADGNETSSISEETAYILTESNTIIGHYKYHYAEKVTQNANTKTTKKVFTNEELIGEKYERLKKYLKQNLHARDDDIETDLQIIIEASSGYYEGEENTSWLQGTSSYHTIITDGKGLISTRNVHLAYSWLYKNYISFWYENSPYHSVHINCTLA